MSLHSGWPVIPPYIPAPVTPGWPAPADNWHWRYALERENARLRHENETLRRANEALRREAEALRRRPPLRMPLPAFW